MPPLLDSTLKVLHSFAQTTSLRKTPSALLMEHRAVRSTRVMNAQLNTVKRWRHRSTSQDDIYATYVVVLSRIHMQKLSMQRNRTAQL